MENPVMRPTPLRPSAAPAAWADARSYEATCDPEYVERHAGDSRHER